MFTMHEKLAKQGYYLIAEIGVNYYDIAKKENISLMQAAKLMIQRATEAGIDAVKFQTYKASTLAAKYSPSYWDTTEEPTTSQYELFQKFDLFGEIEYKELAEYCEALGVDFFSTPFDYQAADYLDKYMGVYKISSSDLSNIPFIEYMAKKGKPILLSTGASELDEVETAVNAIKNNGVEDICLLHCVLEYPTPLEHANLNKITTLKAHYKDPLIGYSDHTKPTTDCDVIKTAFNLGATVIEKHFTLDKTLKGNDHYHAMDPQDVINIKQNLDRVILMRGSYKFSCLATEKSARVNARRSIVTACNVQKGQVLTQDMLTYKRPGIGISPSKIATVMGKIAVEDIKEDTILQLDMIK